MHTIWLMLNEYWHDVSQVSCINVICTWVSQPICTIFMSAIIPSLPFEHCRERCFMRVSKAWPSRDVLLWLLPLPPPLLPWTWLLLALSLVLFSAPSALSPVEIQRLPNEGWQFQSLSPLRFPLPPTMHLRGSPALDDTLYLSLSVYPEIYHPLFGVRKQTSLAGTCQGECSKVRLGA